MLTSAPGRTLRKARTKAMNSARRSERSPWPAPGTTTSMRTFGSKVRQHVGGTNAMVKAVSLPPHDHGGTLHAPGIGSSGPPLHHAVGLRDRHPVGIVAQNKTTVARRLETGLGQRLALLRGHLARLRG